MKVETHIGGAHCVIWRTREHYIDCRKDARRPHLTCIEVVRNGQVYLRDTVENAFAPERVAHYMREEML